MKKLFFAIAFVILLTLPLFASAEGETFQKESGYNKTIVQDYDSGKYGDELYYLSSFGGWGGNGDASISVKDGKATFTFYFDKAPYGKYETRPLSDEEYKRFVDSIEKMNADSMEDFFPGVFDGIEYGYMHFTKDKKSAVYINNPDCYRENKDAVYQKLVDLFWDLKDTGDFEMGIGVPGSQLLINGDEHNVQSVWKKGDDFRVCIEEDHNLKWYSFKNGEIGERTTDPDKITLEGAWDDIPGTPDYYDDWGIMSTDEAYVYTNANSYPWQITWNGYRVRGMRYMSVDGLYLTKEGEKPRLIASGWYKNPLLIPGTDYVVCTEDAQWSQLVKINLQTSEKVVLPIAPELCGLECVAMFGDKNILLRGYFYYYLYNLDTGEAKIIKCDIGMIEAEERFLQKAEGTNKYYTVKQGEQDSVLGVIDIEDFSFTHIKAYEHLRLDPLEVWVDGDRTYAVINGDLVSLPLDDTTDITNTLAWNLLKEKYPDVPDDELKKIIEDNSFNWADIIYTLEEYK